MAVAETLALLAATAAAVSAAGEHSVPAHLGVTATVVRPAEFFLVSTGKDGPVAIVLNSASVQVLTDGGTVARGDEDTATVSSGTADILAITLIY